MTRRHYLWATILSILLMSLGSFNLVQAQNKPLPSGRFEFGLIGDLLYTAQEEAEFPSLIASMNRAKLEFIIHDGDFKNGSSLCSDELFKQRKTLFQTFKHPFIFIPGDNEWTDCHREMAGKYDPLERLAKIRELFASGNQSLGQRTLRLTRQSEQKQYQKFRENVRWTHGNILFVGLNIPGSNNNFGRTPEADAEYVERNAADLAWMRESFELAKRNRHAAIVLTLQANPNFDLPAARPERSGYNDFLAALETETLAFQLPVVLVHGDSHYFRIDKPLLRTKGGRRVENFTRVETFGSPDVHWIRAIVDPTDSDLFQFEQEIVPENKGPRE
jgi:hypothetical protein